MELPNVPRVVRDKSRNIEWTVMAWRKLSDEEARKMVFLHMASRKRAPKKNSRLTIYCSLGLYD
jgi:hypothetical protein